MKTLGKYELLGELGRGAFGIVYRARDQVLNRMVALKTLSSFVSDNSSLLQRFYREAQSAGSLQHPNIVTIYDMGEEGGTPFIAMELIDGQNLDDVIGNRAELSLSLKLVYAVQACRAFDFAHKRGIIHRDIKPANVMVSKQGTVKVVDFGIARVLENSKTQTGMLIGTFSYMAPEVFQGEHANARSDVWSFGVLLYELLAYQRPFGGESPAALMKNVCMQDPIPLRQVSADCPEDLASVVHRMLLKSEAERFQTMEEVLIELETICRRVQAYTVEQFLSQSRESIKHNDFGQARSLLQQALLADSTNQEARLLFDKVNLELKRMSVRPRVEEHVAKGRAYLQERRLHEAYAEAGNALRLDSSFEAAHELQREVQHEIARVRQVNEWLQLLKQHLVEGLPEEAEALLAKVKEADPGNPQLEALQQQVQEERARQQKQLELVESMRQARSLWSQRKYGECISLLTRLQREFPNEEDIGRLLETAREDQSEQDKDEKLTEARTQLSARNYEACISLLDDLQHAFPNDDEISRLLETARADQAGHHKEESLAEARNLLAARRFEECIALLANLQEEFGSDTEIKRLLETTRGHQVEYYKREKLAQARKFLSARLYDDSVTLLSKLREELPGDEEIGKALATARQDWAEFERRQKLDQARALLAAQRFAEAINLLDPLLAADPNDSAVLKMRAMVQHEQDKQTRVQSLQREWENLKKLVADKAWSDVVARGEDLLRQFPGQSDLIRLVEFARKQQAQTEQEARLRTSVEEVQDLLHAGRFADAASAARAGLESFPDNAELTALLRDAEARGKKEMVRQLIEQRVREIRFKINAGELSAAKDLAKETLETLGHDTDVKQLLTSAEVEHEARTKRRDQEQQLEIIRTLIRSGKLSEAATTLNDAMTGGDFHALDPRLYEVADEIEGARKATTDAPAPAEPSRQDPAREYALLEGPPPGDAIAAVAPAMEPPAPPPNLSVSESVAWQSALPIVEKQLATFIGPMARVAVKRAAARASGPDELYKLLAASLDRETDREAFLAQRVGVSQVSMPNLPVSEPSVVHIAAPPVATSGFAFTGDDIDRAARLLARHIGPISRVLVKKAAPHADSRQALYQLLAEHVPNRTERARFLRDAGYPER